MKKSDYEVMNEMILADANSIRVSGTIVETKTVPQGGLITMGVDRKALQDITLPEITGGEKEYITLLLVIDKKKFDSIKNAA